MQPKRKQNLPFVFRVRLEVGLWMLEKRAEMRKTSSRYVCPVWAKTETV
jgi:hypothetical protein